MITRASRTTGRIYVKDSGHYLNTRIGTPGASRRVPATQPHQPLIAVALAAHVVLIAFLMFDLTVTALIAVALTIAFGVRRNLAAGR